MIEKYSSVIILFIFYFYELKKKEKIQISNKKEKKIDFRNRTKKIFNSINLSYIYKLKKLVYTANLGKYDTIRNIKKQKGYDYFLFVDEYDDIYNKLNWTIIYIPEYIKNLNMSLIKKQRFFKTHPHVFFQNYDLSIYIDSTYEIRGNLDEFLVRILTPNISMYMLEHPERNKIIDEFIPVKILKKENKSMITTLKEKYKEEHFPDNNGLIEGCIIVRKHNDKNCIKTMERWYDEIKNYSHRDQLSFNYALWKAETKIKYVSKTFCFKYLWGDYFHKKNYTFK